MAVEPRSAAPWVANRAGQKCPDTPGRKQTRPAIVGTTELNGVTAMLIAEEDDAMFFAIDSSTYTAYSSGGTATPVTFTTVGEISDFDGPGGAAAVIDTTHLTSTAKEKLMGLPDEGQFTFSMNWIPTDTGQSACRTARTARTLKAFRVTYTDSGPTVQTFDAYVLNFTSSGAVDDKVTGNITLEISGAVGTA